MDEKLHRLIESEYAETQTLSRKLYGDAYLAAAERFRSHRNDTSQTTFPLEELEIVGGTSDTASTTGSAESAPAPDKPKSRASIVMSLFDSLDKNHDGRLDKAEIAEGLANFKGHPTEEQALLLLQRNYDLIHRLADPMNFRVGISKDNLTQLRNLEKGEFSLKDELTYNYVRGGNPCLGAGTLGATGTGFALAGPLGAAEGFAFGVAATLSVDYIAVPAMVAIDYSWLNRNKIETFLKDVPAAGCKPKGWLEAAERDSNDDVR